MLPAKPAAGSDFTLPPRPKRQANILLYGDGGVGKTTFALRYAPDPVAFLSFDRRGDNAAWEAHSSGRKVLFTRIDYPANITKLDHVQAQKIGQAGVDKVIRNVEWAVRESQKGNVGSITLDTGTEFNEIITLAIRGRLDKVKGDFGASKDLINRQWWRLLNLAREGDAHFIVLARAAAIWENNEPTGKFKYRGPDVMNDGVDWSGHLRFSKKVPKRDEIKTHEIEVTKAGLFLPTLGQVIKTEDWEDLGGPFVYGCWINFPDSEPQDWGYQPEDE